MKYQIKESIKLRILAFVFLIFLSIIAIYILTSSDISDSNKPKPIQAVGGIAVLEEGKPISFGNNEGTLLLLESTASFPNCADCMETAKIQVMKGNESKVINFRSGGIAGFHDVTDEALDYSFDLRELHDSSVIVEYKHMQVGK